MFDLDKLVTFDTETHLFRPGLMAPPIVCSSWAYGCPGIESGEPTRYTETHLTIGADQTCAALRDYLTGKPFHQDHGIICGANIAYDLAVCAAYDPTLLPLIFEALDQDRVFDVLLATTLHLIGKGCVRKGPNGKQLLYHPDTGELLTAPSKHKNKDGSPKLYNPERVSLDLAVRLVLNRDNTKQNDRWRMRYAILESVPLEDWPDDAKQYPLDDAQNTHELAEEIITQHNAGQWVNLHNLSDQCRSAFPLQLASCWGIRTDPQSVDALERVLREQFNADTKQFINSGFIDAEGNEVRQAVKRRVAEVFGATQTCSTCHGSTKVTSPRSGNDINCKTCDGTGLDLAVEGLPLTDKGGVSTSRDTLAESDDPLLESYADVSNNRKLLNTYTPYLRRGATHPINAEVNVLLASGRVSYSDLVQTQPKKGGVRECHVPRPGFLFSSVDYGQVELCTLAQCQLWISKRSALADALNSGLDPHSLLAAQVLGVSYEEFLEGLRAGNPTYKMYRQAMKAVNFGLPGGMGVPTFIRSCRAYNIRLCVNLGGASRCGINKTTRHGKRLIPPTCSACIPIAESLKASWLRQWPEMKAYFDYVNGEVELNNGTINQFMSNRIRGAVDFCSACNTLFQGLAADGAKRALWYVSRECYTDPSSPLYHSKVLIAIHDEFFSEHPEHLAHNAAHRVSELMIRAMKEYVPDVNITAPPALMRRWYKGAEPVYQNGILVPWEPK